MFVIRNGIQTEQGHSPTKYATSHWDKTHEASMLSWPVNLALVAHNGLAFSEKKAKRTALSYEYTQRYLRLQSYSRTNVNLRNQNDNVEKDYIILYSIEAPSKECWNLVLSLLCVGHDLKEMVYPFLKRSWNAMKVCDFLGENHGKSKEKKKFRFHRFDWLHFLSCCLWSCSLWWGSISFDRLIQVIVEWLPVVSLAVYIPTQFSTAWVESTKAVVERAVYCIHIYIYTHNTYI